MAHARAFAAPAPDKPFAPYAFDRREPGPGDVEIRIAFCGVCHSDLHTARGEWGETPYPCVPGHEIVGHVVRVGDKVSKFKVGDAVGVGCMVDSCLSCDSCREGLEQYCEVGMTGTYGGVEKETGLPTKGGYSDLIVVREEFVLRIPEGMDLASAAPLLCAGITTYSPLRHWKVGPGQKVGVVGLGGLGHMAVKLAHAMGARVVMFTTSPEKGADAKRLGADEVVVSKNADEMAAHVNSFDYILDTVGAPHDLNAYLVLLKRDGTMTLLGGSPEPHTSPQPFVLIMKRRTLAGSVIGGVPETQEMLDFCAQHGIASDIEMIPIQKIDEAYDRMLNSDVKYRFVIDMASLAG